MSDQKMRLYFLDAIRAWAILMMLQGHFIDGLLDNAFRNDANWVFNTWKYFRGITAPVFFTVSGFIFTFLLIRSPLLGWKNPRVKKGLKRGLELIAIGYLLRLNLFGLLKGEVYNSFFLVDVLHCIGLSLLGIIGFYLLSALSKNWIFPFILLATTIILFSFEPLYKTNSFHFLPQFLANYFSKSNGSVFTIIPWLGYATCGGFMAIVFSKYQNHKHVYRHLIPVSLLTGASLIFFSSDVFYTLHVITGVDLFEFLFLNNYLYIRLGDVLIVFSVFMTLRNLFMKDIILKLGKSTLSIYVVHFIILYGSFTGLGLYGFFHHSLSPWIVISGALSFMVICSYLALRYENKKEGIKLFLNKKLNTSKLYITKGLFTVFGILKMTIEKLLRLFGLIKN